MWVNVFVVVGGLAGGAGVGLSAAAAHGLAGRLPSAALATLGTAATFLLIHGLLLLAIAAWSRLEPQARSLRIAGFFAIGGIVFFCGGLSASLLLGLPAIPGGAPLGGLALIASWLTVAGFGLRKLYMGGHSCV